MKCLSAAPAWAGMAFLLCLHGAHTQAAEWVYQLHPAVQAKIAPHFPVHAGPPLARYTAARAFEGPAVAAGLGRVSRFELQRLDYGAVAYTGKLVAQSEKMYAPVTQAITLCGLVTLLRVSGDTAVADFAAPRYGRHAMKYDPAAGERERLMSFEASVPSVCLPAPGSAFTYSAGYEYTLPAFLGQFRSSGLHRRRATVRCTVGAAAFPAGRIDPALGGEALAVSCEEEDAHGRKSVTEYAYLRTSAYYLVRTEVSGSDRVNWRYSGVVYGE